MLGTVLNNQEKSSKQKISHCHPFVSALSLFCPLHLHSLSCPVTVQRPLASCNFSLQVYSQLATGVLTVNQQLNDLICLSNTVSWEPTR